jgi:hypothetical protein
MLVQTDGPVAVLGASGRGTGMEAVHDVLGTRKDVYGIHYEI